MNQGCPLDNLNNMIADIDYFKTINDRYGHHTGDLVLKQTSALLRSSIRREDTLGRWGGEEFIFVLPDTNLAGALAVAEKLREKIVAASFVCNDKKLKITMSFGVNSLNYIKGKNNAMDEAIRRADSNLYQATVRTIDGSLWKRKWTGVWRPWRTQKGMAGYNQFVSFYNRSRYGYPSIAGSF